MPQATSPRSPPVLPAGPGGTLLLLWGLLLGAGWMLPLLRGPAAAQALLVEDGPYESAGALLFLASAALLLAAWGKARRGGTSQVGLLGLALLMLFIGFEEISWGQRIFGWSTPAGLDNVQGETTIHNLRWFDKQTAGRLSMSHMFELFCVGLGFLLPLAVRRSTWLDAQVARWGIPIVPLGLGACFPANYLLSKLYQQVFEGEWISRIAELREWAHALVWFAIAYVIFRAWRGARQRGASGDGAVGGERAVPRPSGRTR